jgi:hypothetical protein
MFLLLLACWSGRALAERPLEDKQTADFILTGRVEKVFQRQEGRLTEHVVLLRVETVHQGEGVKPGESFYAYCFKMAPSPVPRPEASGHDAVPTEGQLIKAYVRHRRGRHEGNYREWFDVLEDAKAKPAAN